MASDVDELHRQLRRAAAWGAGLGLAITVAFAAYASACTEDPGRARDLLGLLIVAVGGGAGCSVGLHLRGLHWTDVAGPGRVALYALLTFGAVVACALVSNLVARG